MIHISSSKYFNNIRNIKATAEPGGLNLHVLMTLSAHTNDHMGGVRR